MEWTFLSKKDMLGIVKTLLAVPTDEYRRVVDELVHLAVPRSDALMLANLKLNLVIPTVTTLVNANKDLSEELSAEKGVTQAKIVEILRAREVEDKPAADRLNTVLRQNISLGVELSRAKEDSMRPDYSLMRRR